MRLQIKANSDYLKANDVKSGDVVVILNEGEVREADFGTGKARTVFEVEVEHDKKRKTWTMNKTTIKKIIEGFGEDTKAWVGKRVKLDLVKTNVKGNVKDSIIGEPLDEEVKTGPVEAEVIKL